MPARGSSRYHINALASDELCQVERVVGLLLGGNDKRLAVEICHAYVLQRRVKRDCCHAQDAVGIGEHGVGKHIGRMAIEVVAYSLVTQHYTLGTACRAAGVNQVGEVVGSDVGLAVLGIAFYQFFHVDCLLGRHGVHLACSSDDVSRLAVLKDEFDTVGRILGVARDVGSTSLEHTKEREHQAAGAWQQQSHTVARLNTTLLQRCGYASGHLVHFHVGELAVDCHQSLVLGLSGGVV